MKSGKLKWQQMNEERTYEFFEKKKIHRGKNTLQKKTKIKKKISEKRDTFLCSQFEYESLGTSAQRYRAHLFARVRCPRMYVHTSHSIVHESCCDINKTYEKSTSISIRFEYCVRQKNIRFWCILVTYIYLYVDKLSYIFNMLWFPYIATHMYVRVSK